MKNKTFFFFLILIYVSIGGHTQKVFFTSSNTFTPKPLNEFYASVSIRGSLLIFNAPDYNLYAYDINSGKQKWVLPIRRRSNIPPCFVKDRIWVTANEGAISVDTSVGSFRKLVFEDIQTAPFIKGDIAYGTALYDGGCIYAYDLKSDSVIWKRFIAHGCHTKPFFLSNKIIANADGDRWIDILYSGRLKEKGCDAKSDLNNFAGELPCARSFKIITHDFIEIEGKKADRFLRDASLNTEVYRTADKTFIINDGFLVVLGNKLKKISQLELSDLADEMDAYAFDEAKILWADQAKVWLLADNRLLIYDFNTNTLAQNVNLGEWEPHRVIVDGNRLWLISKKDGKLYGIEIP